MRDLTEIRLLNLRQRHKDELLALRAARVVNLRAFKIAYVMYKACEYILMEYRRGERDVA